MKIQQNLIQLTLFRPPPKLPRKTAGKKDVKVSII